MIHQQPEVKELMQKMRELLFDFAILGGYPRDIANNRTPKDMDICVYNYHPTDRAEIMFASMLRKWLEEKDMIREAYDEHHPSATGDNRVYHVVSLHCGVDIIFWNAQTKWEVINNFDFNINQYELAVSDDNYTPVYHGNNHGVLGYIRPHDDLSQERVDHVVDIADSLGWDTCLLNKKSMSFSQPTSTPPSQN